MVKVKFNNRNKEISAVENNPSTEVIIPEEKFSKLSEEEKFKIREKVGLTYKFVCEKIVSLLEANVLSDDGKKTVIAPNNTVRVKAIEPALKVLGVARDGGDNSINFNMTVGERSEIKARILRAVKGNTAVGVIVNGN